ncbi:MAG: HAD-IC family P-type ATPase [Planctomycetota bacterium]
MHSPSASSAHDTSTGSAWHALDDQQLARELGTDLARGLRHEEVIARRRRFGANELLRTKSPGIASRLLRQLRSPLVLLLAAASALAFGLGERVDGCVIAAVLCNDADVTLGPEARWLALGDPTEAALAVLGRKCGFDVAELRGAHPRTAEVPFDPALRRMAIEHANARTIVKGAPEVVLAACDSDGERWLERADELAARGLRVLALACAERPLRAGIDSGLRCLGLVAQLDPPRPEAREALATCARAGVRVIMLTGDHRRTAAAIAESLGLQPRDAPVVEGRELERMDDAELERACEHVRVFARGAAGYRWLFIGLAASVALQLLVMYVPLSAGWFHAVHLPLEQVAAIVALASCGLWIEEARKFRARRGSPTLPPR